MQPSRRLGTGIKCLEADKKAFPGGISLLEAFKFSRYVMAVPTADEVLVDPQIRGKCQRLAVQAPSPHQARPLTVAEVARLEKAMRT